MATETKTMRGWAQEKTGQPLTVLKLRSDLPYPTLVGPKEVLVKISHAALNPGGAIFIMIVPMIFRTKPSISEMNFAGSVVTVGTEVPISRGMKEGVDVFGSIPPGAHLSKGKGAMAEYVVVDADQVVLRPGNVPASEASGLATTGCSALKLLDVAKLKEEDRVLINAASGGVGSLAVQMARRAVGEKGKVVAICSGGNAEMVKGLGADEIVDYTKYEKVWTYLATACSDDKKFDCIIDCRGNNDLFLHCPNYLKPGMPFISIGIAPPGPINWGAMLWAVSRMLSNSLWPRFLGGVDRPYKQITAISNLEDMKKLAKMTEAGQLKVHLDSCWEMEDGLKAYERQLSNHARGKVIVHVAAL